MRFRSRPSAAGQLFAVTGVNTVSFGVVAGPATKDGLLGFAVERVDEETGASRFMSGFKVFPSVVPDPKPGIEVSTTDHPVQSFVWDDFTARPGHDYVYRFHPVKGRPGALDRTGRPLTVAVRTEPLFTTGRHDVFFNRGVASSQAYTRRFGTDPIDKLAPAKRAEALDWLSRDLDEAILRFIGACQSGDRLLGCFYEFRYAPVAEALRAAVDRGVDVALVVDGKINGSTGEDGTVHESFPREDNLRMLEKTGLRDRVTLRLARRSAIAHNKFMVRVAGGRRPAEVWTGSTNLSLGGVHGQTNVGHWVRDRGTAERFAAYWELLSGDPGGRADDPPSVKTRKNKEFLAAVRELSPTPEDLANVPAGITPTFSPQPDDALLTGYAALLDSAEQQASVTLAFGINATLKGVLSDNTAANHLVFLLLEKKDAPANGSRTPFVRLTTTHNVYQAWGSFITDPVGQLAAEAHAGKGKLGLNQHVSFIHSKFMLIDPLGADPIVVTGSANFSTASTKDNDENMLVIRGARRVADIYHTEFNRLFNHYYFRSVVERLGRTRRRAGQPSIFLDETTSWQEKYQPGTFRAKRLALFAGMAGFGRS